MRISDVRDALLTVLPGMVFHFHAPGSVVDGKAAYAVWGETSLGSASADDGFAEWAPAGIIYFYTQVEYDARLDALILALEAAGIAVSPGRIGYDERTEMTAYEIGWAVDCGPGELYAEPEADGDE